MSRRPVARGHLSSCRGADQAEHVGRTRRSPVTSSAGRATAIDPQRRSSTSSTLSAGAFTVSGHVSAYGRRVSGAMENRAAVFTSHPQSVEVYQAGTWWAGELLGWRHDASGSCQVWVRVVLGGVEETAWTDLASLRLPERHLAVAGESSTAPAHRGYGPGTQEMSVARHPSGRRARPADDAATAGLPMVRDLSVVPDLPATGGRRTADETAQFASVGRRRAPELQAEPPTGGRRRAPETAEAPSVGQRRGHEVTLTTGRPPVPPGRHRAPADPGRHRTADTGILPATTEAAPTQAGRPEDKAARSAGPVSRPRVPAAPTQAARAQAAPAQAVQALAARAQAAPAPSAGGQAPRDLDSELLTRPMRLTDHMPHGRRPRLDGSLRGV